MKTHTSYHTFNTKKRQEIIDITDLVEKCRAEAGITEGMVLVSAMHISASVFVNDHESARHPRRAGLRPLAARLLRRVGRAEAEASRHQGDGCLVD